MPYIDLVGDLMRVTIAATYPDNQVQETDLCYICTVAGGTDTRPALGANLYNLIGTSWQPIMSNTSSLYGYKVSRMQPRPAPLPAILVSTNAGAINANVAPTQSRPLIATGTAMAGRGYRGRMYMFTPNAACTSATGFLLAAYLTALQTIAAAIPTPFSSAGTTWVPVLAHRHAGPPSSYTFDPITSATARNKIATMRKSGNYGRVNNLPW